jgi:hypothetical protein
MPTPSPLIDAHYVIEKFEGKGGWHFVQLPEIAMNKEARFGWVRVRGEVDGYELKQYNLMPMGNGKLFLPLKAQLRKAIKKQVGDSVHVKLFLDNSPYKIPDEIVACLEVEPKAYQAFLQLSDNQQKSYIDWIYEAKQEMTKEKRIIDLIEQLIKL